MKSRLDLFRMGFLIIFIVASFSAFSLYLNNRRFVISPEVSPNPIEAVEIDWDSLTTIGSSLVTSLVALFGFWITTTLSLRKEKREARESELALKQKEIELERMRLELEQLKKKSYVRAKKVSSKKLK